LTPLETRLADRVRDAAGAVLGAPWTGPVPVEVTNRPDLGDYATAIAFQLARTAQRPPLAIAEDLATELQRSSADILDNTTAIAPAFVNMRLTARVLEDVVTAAHESAGRLGDSDEGAGVKIVVEHTNVNPNKAAHVGHLRNACLGDSLCRILARRGFDIEVQNYIDDTGVQVADVVVGLHFLDPAPQGVQAFDRYCSDVYKHVAEQYAADPSLLERRTEVQHAIESGSGELAALARDVTRRVAVGNLRTMSRAGVGYDLLTWESHILSLGFWESTFELLKQTNAIRYESDGPNAGCWVLPFGQGTMDATGRAVTDDKVLVTTRGIATYTAKDLAYQLWKFGLLDRDFRYHRFNEDTGQTERDLWSTTDGDGDPAAPVFAGATRVINVIDASQSYPQQVVYEALRRLGFDAAAERSEHLAYGFVSLTPEAARTLGADVDIDLAKVAMSGRAGIQVFADDLLDQLAEIIARRSADADAERMAAAAARYYMLKFSNHQEITFDFDEALRTTGETGVYLQYAYVRANGILRKVGADGPAPACQTLEAHDRQLVLRMADYPRLLAVAASTRSVSTIAKYAFELCAAFNTFYDNTPPVVSETDLELRAWRIGLVSAFRYVAGDVMNLLGIQPLERI
jgi:arginyl-tRNA synthetase